MDTVTNRGADKDTGSGIFRKIKNTDMAKKKILIYF